MWISSSIVLYLQKDIMDILFDLFRLPVPIWTSNFQEALASVGELNHISSMKSSASKTPWCITQVIKR